MRERRPGVWEIRVVVANDLLTGRSVQRSFTVHADRELAEQHRRALVERFGVGRSALYCEGARWSVAELLERFIDAEHQWRPATRSSHTSVVRFLTRDPLGRVGVAALTPMVVDQALARWRATGGSAALVWGRWAVLHSCLSWAAAQGMVRSNPILGMRAPMRPTPRKHLLPAEVTKLLRTAAEHVREAEVALRADPRNRVRWEGLFVAEQTRLLVRLAADTGARRGELATLRVSDLDGRVLTIERNLSLEVLGPTKTGRTRRMTIGTTTAEMIRTHFEAWERRAGADAVQGDWVFAPDFRRLTYARADLLSHRFSRLREAADLPDAALHRFRHSVATHLVADGKLLKAQARLGHRDPATTLRHYAHAAPLDDLDIADEIDEMLNECVATGSVSDRPPHRREGEQER
jgi:integrase